MREKLIELISYFGDCLTTEQREIVPNTRVVEIADHLIANGVTFATDNNVGSKWIPRTEPPKKNGRYLCRYVFYEYYDMPFEQVISYFATDKEPHFANENSEYGMKVTHWMPLPEPPREE